MIHENRTLSKTPTIQEIYKKSEKLTRKISGKAIVSTDNRMFSSIKISTIFIEDYERLYRFSPFKILCPCFKKLSKICFSLYPAMEKERQAYESSHAEKRYSEGISHITDYVSESSCTFDVSESC